MIIPPGSRRPSRLGCRSARFTAVVLFGSMVWQAIVGNEVATIYAAVGFMAAADLARVCRLLALLACRADEMVVHNGWLTGENARLETANLELAVLVAEQHGDFPPGPGGRR